jgi:phosphoribosylaminoimidazole-succinocarboxamide synthase
MPETLFNSDLKSLPLIGRGKVRDIYGVGEDRLLIVTTDRLSAFDVRGAADCDPGQGRGAYRGLQLLVRTHPRPDPQPPHRV